MAKKKYHQDKCPYAKNLKSMSLEDTIKEEYTPCKICNEKIDRKRLKKRVKEWKKLY